MVGVYNKPNRGVRPYLRTDTESDEPLKKPKTIGISRSVLKMSVQGM